MNKPWQQQSGEDDQCYAVFLLWLHMSPVRDVEAAWRLHTGLETVAGVPNHIDAAFHADEWERRAKAWDIDDEITANLYWKYQRLKVWPQTEYEVALRILNKAREMTEWPIDELQLTVYSDKGELVTLSTAERRDIEDMYSDGLLTDLVKKYPDYRVVVVQSPAKWAWRDVGTLLKAASEVGRLAAQMEQKVEKMVFTLSPEVLEAIDKLAAFGVTLEDVLSLFERQVIEAPVRYELASGSNTTE